MIVAACDGAEDTAPAKLMDGSAAQDVPVELEGIDDPTVLTKSRVVRAADGRRDAVSVSCLRGRTWSIRAAGLSVVRVGVSSESVTFRGESGRSVFGCDNSPGPREGSRRWCGGAYGMLFDGRLRDPVLDLICDTGDGEPMGFVWIEPGRNARYVVVEQPGYAEVYEVAGGLPVRVATTTGVEIEGSRAGLDLREHAADGRLLRAYRLEAAVAG